MRTGGGRSTPAPGYLDNTVRGGCVCQHVCVQHAHNSNSVCKMAVCVCVSNISNMCNSVVCVSQHVSVCNITACVCVSNSVCVYTCVTCVTCVCVSSGMYAVTEMCSALPVMFFNFTRSLRQSSSGTRGKPTMTSPSGDLTSDRSSLTTSDCRLIGQKLVADVCVLIGEVSPYYDTSDNIWTDQNLLLDPDLPSGWRTIKDSTGTYYWHVPTGATQWQHPRLSGTPQLPDTKQEEAGQQSSTREKDGPPEARSSWHEDYLTNHDPDSKCFAVRSLGWLEVEEEDLSPGRSSLAVSNVIQQLSHCGSPEQRDRPGAWGEGREMMLVLKKDTLTLLDPLDHTPLHCQPIINIRVWGVGCNNGRDFAFVAGDKESCVLKCHVFRCNAPAKAIATALHEMCSKVIYLWNVSEVGTNELTAANRESQRPFFCLQMMSEKTLMRPSRSLTMESISPEDLPRQVEFLEAVRQQVQKFEVQYIGNLPVSRAMAGMEVLNRAIESIMNCTDRDEWEPAVIHVTDNVLSLWKGEEGEEPFWECQVRFLTFLGVGHDSHTFAVIVDGGTQRFECHVFWCEPDAGILSEAVQAACMVQYQKCLVAQTPPPRTKSWRATPSKVKRANSMDSAAFPPLTARHHGNSSSTMMPRITKGNGSSGNVRKGMMAFFETFRNKQTATS
ncbi:hypothetical protein L3Q82_022635 [Scortum barcoo]|uniref:Uncharacterized protein n=1 Tax=Scortum barcoo TaxID=214431 RepID=A0ACB8X1U9_9TELE|nr:hypothetical protein L3Q82_022635 [Scortum barcoo]